jgi:hypothetical protein
VISTALFATSLVGIGATPPLPRHARAAQKSNATLKELGPEVRRVIDATTVTE